MAMGEEVGDAYISVHADTSPFRRQMALLRKEYAKFAKDSGKLDGALRRNQKVMDRSTNRTNRLGRALDRTGKKGNFLSRRLKSLSGAFRRMDGTVKLVVTLIATAGSMMAALGSAAAGAGVAIAAAGALALAALSPLLGVLAPLVYGIKLVKDSLTDEFGNFTTEKIAGWAPDAARAMEDFSDAVHKIDASALWEHWNDSLATFLDTLGRSLTFDKVAAGIGDAFSMLTDSLTKVLDSSVWTDFVGAVEGPLTAALGNLLAAAGPLLSVLLQFMTAAAPFALILSEQFLLWAENLEKAFAASVASGEFTSFMELATTALGSVLDLLGSLGDALGTVFLAGAPAGIELLDMITGFIDKFNEWANTIEGQTALKQWFEDAVTVMTAVFDLVGDLGAVLGELVTPAVIQDLVEFLGALGGILPVLGDLLAILANAHVLDIFTAAIGAIGDVITPLVDPLSRFFDVFSAELLGIIEGLGPVLGDIGGALGKLFDALTPLLPALATFISNGLAAILPVAVEVIEIVADLLSTFEPFLTKILESEETIDILMGILGAFLAFKAIKGVVGIAQGAMGAMKAGLGTLAGKSGALMNAEKLKNIEIQAESNLLKKNAAQSGKTGGAMAKLKTMASKVGGAFKTAGIWVANMTVKLAAGTVAVAKNVASWVAQKAALVASKAAMLAQKVATVAATAIQWLYNAALTANPLGLIVAAIAAVVAGLVLFFTKTELGKKIWQGFMDAMVVVWDWLKGAFKWLADVAGSIWDGISDAWDAGVQMVQDLLTKLWDFIKEVFGWTPLGLIIENWDAIVGFFSTMWTNIATAFTTGIDTVLGFLSGIFNWFAGLWDTISAFISTVWTNITAAFQVGVDTVLGFLGGIWDWYVNLSVTIAGYVVTAWEAIKSAFKNGIDAVLGFLGGIWKWYTDLRDKVGAVILTAWANIKGKFSEGVTAVLESLGKVWKWYTDLRDKVGAVITTAWSTIKQKFQDGVTAVMDKLKDVWEWFKDLPNDIKGFFSGLATTISQPFKNAFNSVADAWNNTVGKLSWTVPSWVPKLGGSTIQAPKIPKFAAGTIALKPTIGEFGEAGPEALVPLNRPLSQVDPSVRALSAFAQGLGGSGTTIESGAIVVNTPSTNGRVVAESVLDRLVSYSR